MEFIFMLTHGDRTVNNAIEVYRRVASTGLRLVGFKDVGVSSEVLRALTDSIHSDDRSVFVEVVSTSRDDELRSIEAAVEVGVDYVLGGTHVDDALKLLDGAPIQYYPFPGVVVGHPSELQGSIADISRHAAELTARPGVSGLDLLAYRQSGADPVDLTRTVVDSAEGPVIVAGSIDSEERIRAMAGTGAWAFTIGSALFDGLLHGSPSIPDQVKWVLEVAER